MFNLARLDTPSGEASNEESRWAYRDTIPVEDELSIWASYITPAIGQQVHISGARRACVCVVALNATGFTRQACCTTAVGARWALFDT